MRFEVGPRAVRRYLKKIGGAGLNSEFRRASKKPDNSLLRRGAQLPRKSGRHQFITVRSQTAVEYIRIKIRAIWPREGAGCGIDPHLRKIVWILQRGKHAVFITYAQSMTVSGLAKTISFNIDLLQRRNRVEFAVPPGRAPNLPSIQPAA
jgi:hypothetical protein